RSHLRSLRPFPKDELLVLKRAVSELGAIVRDLGHIARAMQAGHTPVLAQPDLRAVLRVCEVLRNDTKALIEANMKSSDQGHERNRDCPDPEQERRCGFSSMSEPSERLGE